MDFMYRVILGVFLVMNGAIGQAFNSSGNVGGFIISFVVAIVVIIVNAED